MANNDKPKFKPVPLKPLGDTATGLSPIIHSAGFGYVVENFFGTPNKYTGEWSDVLTTHGKPCIFPDMESVPPLWRKYAKPATTLQAARGEAMPRVVNIVREEQMRGR